MTTTHENLSSVDRSNWSQGPWDQEPDRVEWNYRGVTCLAIRAQFGTWCGYVGIKPGHPLYKVPHQSLRNVIEVHGGLTYSDICNGHVCHMPAPGEENDLLWWLGFDCGHAFDMSPGMEAYLQRIDAHYKAMGIYRDLDYVKAEVHSLVQQVEDFIGK